MNVKLNLMALLASDHMLTSFAGERDFRFANATNHDRTFNVNHNKIATDWYICFENFCVQSTPTFVGQRSGVFSADLLIVIILGRDLLV
jgi:hypothetical protein